MFEKRLIAFLPAILIEVTNGFFNKRLIACMLSFAMHSSLMAQQSIQVFVFGEGTYCEGDIVDLRALPGGGQNQSYEWTLPDGTQATGPVLSLGQVDPSDAGTYQLYVFLTNNPAVNTTLNLVVDVVPLPRINLDAEVYVCDNENYISAAIVDFSDDMLWVTSGDGLFLQPDAPEAGYVPGPADLQSAMVTLTLTANSYNSGMCDPAIATVVIRIREAPELQFVITKESDCDDQNGSITIFMPGPVADYTYSLDGISFYNNNHFSGLSAATYNIMAADVNGCRAFYPDNPFVLAQMEECNEEFIMPNAFVPLSSNIVNNTFYPIWVNSIPSEYSMLIYNKWGELVFETRNPYAGWDGRSNNELLPAETYAYVVRVKFIHDAGAGFKEQRGSVRLVR